MHKCIYIYIYIYVCAYLFIICLDYEAIFSDFVNRRSKRRLTKSEKMASSWQRKEAEGTPQKQLPTPTTPMT